MSVYPQTCQQESQVDMNILNRLARGVVKEVMRRCKMSPAECQIFYADMVQEALTELYERLFLDNYVIPYAYGCARLQLIGFVLEQVRWKQNGFKLEHAKKYRVYDNLVEPEGPDKSLDWHMTTQLPGTYYQPRPVETAVIEREEAPEKARMWTQFEREVARILAIILRRQWHPNRLRRAAAVACERAKGTSRAGIALKLEMSLEAVDTLYHYRQFIRQFLALSPVMQGLIRAEGELRLYWWDEVTHDLLNAGHKFIIIFPHGAFTVGYQRKPTGKIVGRIQSGRRVNGKPVNRSVWLGQLGSITYDKVYKGSLKLQEKVAQLPVG